MSWQKIERFVRWLLIVPCGYYACAYYLELLWFSDPTFQGLVLAVSLTFAAGVISDALSSNHALRLASLAAAGAGLVAIAIPDGNPRADRLLDVTVVSICLVHFLFRIYLYGWRRRLK